MREINEDSEMAADNVVVHTRSAVQRMGLLKRRQKHHLCWEFLHTFSQANMTFDNLLRNRFTCTNHINIDSNITLFL